MFVCAGAVLNFVAEKDEAGQADFVEGTYKGTTIIARIRLMAVGAGST